MHLQLQYNVEISTIIYHFLFISCALVIRFTTAREFYSVVRMLKVSRALLRLQEKLVPTAQTCQKLTGKIAWNAWEDRCSFTLADPIRLQVVLKTPMQTVFVPNISFWSSWHIWKHFKKGGGKSMSTAIIWLSGIMKSWISCSRCDCTGFIQYSLDCLHFWSCIIQNIGPETFKSLFHVGFLWNILTHEHCWKLRCEPRKARKLKLKLILEAKF